LRLFHAVLEPLATNQLDGFHQRASGVTQQNPIDRIMNVGAQAGGVEEGTFQIHRLGQGQPLGGGGAHAQELLNHWPDLGLGPPLVVTFERALAGHGDAGQFTEAAEVLEQRAIGQAGGKAAIVLGHEGASDVAAQRASAVALAVLLGLGADLLVLAPPTLQIFFHQASFQAAGNQQGIDAQQLVAELAIIEVALNGGQDLRQRRQA